MPVSSSSAVLGYLSTFFGFVQNVYDSMPDNLKYIVLYSFGCVLVISLILLIGGWKG